MESIGTGYLYNGGELARAELLERLAGRPAFDLPWGPDGMLSAPVADDACAGTVSQPGHDIVPAGGSSLSCIDHHCPAVPEQVLRSSGIAASAPVPLDQLVDSGRQYPDVAAASYPSATAQLFGWAAVGGFIETDQRCPGRSVRVLLCDVLTDGPVPRIIPTPRDR